MTEVAFKLWSVACTISVSSPPRTVFLALVRSLALLSLFGLWKDKSQATKRVRVAGGAHCSTPVRRGSSCSGRDEKRRAWLARRIGTPVFVQVAGSPDFLPSKGWPWPSYRAKQLCLSRITDPRDRALRNTCLCAVYSSRLCSWESNCTCWRAIDIKSYFFLLLFPRLFLFSCVRIRFLWFLHVLFWSVWSRKTRLAIPGNMNFVLYKNVEWEF